MIPLAIVFTITVSLPGIPSVTEQSTMPPAATMADCENAIGWVKLLGYVDGMKVQAECKGK